MDDITDLLAGLRNGDNGARDRLFELAYDELHQLARQVRRGRAHETLNTTGLVHEAYLKLVPARGLPAVDRAHFLRLMARAMRQVLVDSARRHMAAKRGGQKVQVTLDTGVDGGMEIRIAELLDLDRALDDLRTMDRRRADVVECRFFAGLDVEETATALGVSSATVKRDWRVARAWLAQAVGMSGRVEDAT